jgi:hypothetical protein
MTAWWICRPGGSGTPIATASQALTAECREGPLDDTSDAELMAFLDPPPQSVTRLQAMVALSNAGLLGQVQTWIASQDALTQLIWNSATDFSRNSALLASVGAALALTPAQIDALFAAAAKIAP